MTFQIGPIVSPLFYSEGRDIIPSFTGPFKSSRELFDTLIQKEKSFFENHDVQKLIIKDKEDAEKLPKLLEQLASLQYKLSENSPFESIDLLPFTLIHGDFDGQNILVERSVDNDIKIVGIIDWELSYTGTLYNLCRYPCWIGDIEFGPYEVPSDKMLQENRENQDLRAYFRDEMVTIFGDKGGQLLDMREKDSRIEDLMFMFLHNHNCSLLEKLLECTSVLHY
jgi:hypothetical protein